VTIHPTGRPIAHLLIKVLRRPVDSALHPAIRVMNQPVGPGGLTVVQRLFQRVQRQVGAQAG